MSVHDWKFIQSFGDDNSNDDDLVTAVEFETEGKYLAVGDKAGRICIFEGQPPRTKEKQTQRAHPLEYKFYTEFQSHSPKFDYLKSLELSEKINMIKWAKRQNDGLFVLVTNDKTIKLWKVHEKKIKRPSRSNTLKSSKPNAIYIPTMTHYQTVTTATSKKVYDNAHNYHINSISINSDGATFISADDLRINLWNLEISNESFNIVDIKPPNLEELTEVITTACMHPTNCNILMYSSSRGNIRLADMRESALCDQHSKLFEIEEQPGSKSFFTEIISSIADAKFTQDGRYIMARDYMTVKIWDVKMEAQPVLTVPVHDYLNMYHTDLYENDCIFDKFEVACSQDGQSFVTGSYNNFFLQHDMKTKESVTIEAQKDPPPKLKPGEAPPEPNVQSMDFGKKALHVAWHPELDVVAVAGLNKLYIYESCKPRYPGF